MAREVLPVRILLVLALATAWSGCVSLGEAPSSLSTPSPTPLVCEHGSPWAQGIVEDAAGKPLEKVFVAWWLYGGPYIVVDTDAWGRFGMCGSVGDPAHCELRFNKAGFEERQITDACFARQPMRVVLAPARRDDGLAGFR